MSNTLTNVIPQILAEALLALRGMVIMPSLVNTDYGTDAAKQGSTIDVPIPSAIAARSVTPGVSATQAVDIAPTTVAIALDQWYEAPFYLTDKEVAEVTPDTLPMQASEAVKSLARQVNAHIFGKYAGVYGYVGVAGTTPFQTSTSEARDARKVLNEQLANGDERRMVLDTDADAAALGLDAIANASAKGDKEALAEGMIGRVLAFDWFYDQQVPTHTTGAVGTILVDEAGAVAVGATTIHMDGFTTKASVGDIFTIAGDTQTYVVITASDLAGTDSDIVFQPPLKVALPDADTNEAVTFKATHAVNLAFHRDAFAFASRPLEVPTQGLGSIITAATDPISGISLRLEVSRQAKQTEWNFDILWGSQLVRAALACRVAG